MRIMATSDLRGNLEGLDPKGADVVSTRAEHAAQCHHFSCLRVGEYGQPEPLDVEPHQMHLLPPGP